MEKKLRLKKNLNLPLTLKPHPQTQFCTLVEGRSFKPFSQYNTDQYNQANKKRKKFKKMSKKEIVTSIIY